MTTDTLTLTAFLLLRIAEDEAVAREAATGEWWHDGPTLRTGKWWLTAGSDVVGKIDRLPDADHIARHDPAHVLAECKAKRAIVEVHDETSKSRAFLDYEFGDPDLNDVMGPLRDVIRALASVYADHDSFKEEWAS